MKLRIAPIQEQKTILAPSMQKSIEVLLMPIVELNTAIEEELQNNPLLEIDEEKESIERNQLDQFIYRNLNRLLEPLNSVSYDTYHEDDEPQEKPIANTVPLENYLLQQLHCETDDPLEIKIGEMIIGNLDEDGYLKTTCEEIAQLLILEEIEIVEKVLSMIQNFEPLGIASRHIQECLLIQARSQLIDNVDLVTKIIGDHFHDLGHKKFREIAKRLKIPSEKVKEIAQTISKLEPKPARKYRPIQSNIYIKPDITISKNEEGFQIQINQDNIPPLRINRIYQNILKQPNRSEEEIDFIRANIKNALLFIRSIEQRHQTLKEITSYILNHQKDFFEKEDITIRPMVLKDVAKAIGRNESTVCRAINNKYMQTLQGLFPLKFFFSHVVSQETNGSLSCQTVKEELKVLIKEEDKTKPLSDQEIQFHFEQKGMYVARRTIAKYRQTLRILPSYLRKV